MEITSDDIFLDFETRSRADLKSVGAWRYAEDPSTSALCLAYSFGNAEPDIWVEGGPQPIRLFEAFRSGKRIHGWNSLSFERAIFEVIMGPKFGWPTPRLEQYHDTMSDALALALPAGLDACGEAVNATIKKDKAGKDLIRRLCKPISAGKKKGEFRERSEHIAEYSSLYSYCKQDVRAEREIYSLLPYHVTGKNREIMLMVARMNERGLPIDLVAVRAIAKAIEEEKDSLCVAFHLLTGVPSPTNRAKFLNWLNRNGLHIEDTQKETLRDAILAGGLSDKVLHVLQLASEITKTSNAKYQAILNSVCSDGTVKNNLIYHKANTGRLAGAGFQVQNLVSAAEKEPEPLIECFIDEDLYFVHLWNGVLGTASGLIRSMIKAFPGMKFLNGDLKGIEARGSAWASREWDVLKMLGEGMDVYRITAAKMYAKAIDAISKEERQAGKISVLAGGFGGAHNALINMARKMGIVMTEMQAKGYVKDFRNGRKQLVKTWWAFGDAALNAMDNPGVVCSPEVEGLPVDTRFKFIKHGEYLYLVLPSGRKLSFPFPTIHEEFYKGRLRRSVAAMWVDSYTHKWSKRIITGASFFQSAVQALCADLLMEAQLRIEDEGLPLILSVHDEGMSMVPDDRRYTVARYEQLLCVVPEWAKGFPIAADCWEGYRFKK